MAGMIPTSRVELSPTKIKSLLHVRDIQEAASKRCRLYDRHLKTAKHSSKLSNRVWANAKRR